MDYRAAVKPMESEPLVVSTAFGTVSEYFFLTMRAMHVGYLSSCSALQRLLCDPTAAEWLQD